MQTSFIDNLYRIKQQTNSTIGLYLKPIVSRMPLPIRIYDDPFFPFAKAVINATHDIVCAYIFDLAAYLNIGAAGAVALERSIAYVGKDNLKILHGPFSGPEYSYLMEENAFDVDALTLANQDDIKNYLYRPDRTAFVMCNSQQSDLSTDLYITSEHLLRINMGNGNQLAIWLADSELPYQSSGEDFAEVLRQNLLEFQTLVNNKNE